MPLTKQEPPRHYNYCEDDDDENDEKGGKSIVLTILVIAIVALFLLGWAWPESEPQPPQPQPPTMRENLTRMFESYDSSTGQTNEKSFNYGRDVLVVGIIKEVKCIEKETFWTLPVYEIHFKSGKVWTINHEVRTYNIGFPTGLYFHKTLLDG
ncbi:MAG: hypothetical protein U9N04_00130 [Patescibacteria group bacterium]|nr:hypothetical protein [Patescibacteria group bacterium]